MLEMNIKDALGRGFNTFHRNVFLATNGRVMGNLIGMPALLLTTTGRRSGKKRQSMLTAPIHDDDRVVIVASWGGDDRHPKWYLNLRDNPDVEVVMKGRRRPMRARIAKDEEREELWREVTSRFKNYADYQTKTDRVIPLVVLEPRR
jgi:deazaflavin-dependent oxidoreductase (nitroreductase family)